MTLATNLLPAAKAMPRTSVVTDDVRAIRELVARWLSELGYETNLESDGDAAWDAIAKIEPDLVVTDVEMPGMCGLELLREIREHSNQLVRKIPVIVISSLQDVALQETALGLGATAVLEKPLVKTEFQKVVHQITCGELHPIGSVNSTENKMHTGPISPTLRQLIERTKNR